MKSIILGLLVLICCASCGETPEERLQREADELKKDLQEMGDKIKEEQKELDKINQENQRVSEGIDSTKQAIDALEKEMP